MIFLFVCLGGGLGGAARFLIDSSLPARLGKRWFPMGTLVVNALGSFLLGLFAGLAVSGSLSTDWLAILGTGFFGGLTTFSTASTSALRLARESGLWWLLAYAGGMAVLCVTLAAAGLALTG